MNEPILISICIPAYKRASFLKRLLDSIKIQKLQSFEVIVTDDSPDENIKMLCVEYSAAFKMHYFKNPQPLGTPENWNEAIRRARGKWIKLMHDDDWFADENSLEHFVDATTKNPEASFFFGAYTNMYESGRLQAVFPGQLWLRWLKKNPVILFAKNVIGPPSVTLTRNDERAFYDKRIKWVVDIDFYMRYLNSEKPVYIDKLLLNVGLGAHQVTMDCARQRPIEIPENFYLLNKVGVRHLKSIVVYDAWWRLMRNLEIRNESDIREAGYAGKIPVVIISIIRWQQKLPRLLLKIGMFSKAIMFVHYIFNKAKI